MEISIRSYYMPFPPDPEGHIFRTVAMPTKVQVLSSALVTGRGRIGNKLVLRVRQMGEPHLPRRFMLKFADFGDIPLPKIKPGKHDAPDSDDLQWYLWQGRRVAGDVRYDVFDVTDLELVA